MESTGIGRAYITLFISGIESNRKYVQKKKIVTASLSNQLKKTEDVANMPGYILCKTAVSC
jgi:hypothetical protein